MSNETHVNRTPPFGGGYRVLARKYRPVTFDALIGQEVLVRTLSNAIATGRIAHAFLLTGIRGVGKTTTARLIARALNCIGEDAKGGPTISPCGVCTHCKMIGEDRHIDVLEMDAASHTGVGDIRDLIETVRYLPGSARYKVYIIDEVHMLSNSAFNALLKTLEEPPPHVKFVFATTEARKIPVTILSRCQRFDLKRVSAERLAQHLAAIGEKEGVVAEPEALALIAAAAEGSVRDSLSLFDQAIAHGADDADGARPPVSAATVRAMLGVADSRTTRELLEALLSGDISLALEKARAQYQAGADPLAMAQDALEIIHTITRFKVIPGAKSDLMLSEEERNGLGAIAERLSMPVITRLWQMWLKGVQEMRVAPAPIQALEMLLVRIAYAASLPTPAEALKDLARSTPAAASVVAVTAPAPIVQPAPTAAKPAPVAVASFNEAVQLFERNKEALLFESLRHDVRLVSFSPGDIEVQPIGNVSREFAAKVAEYLTRWTGSAWRIRLSQAEGEPSLAEQDKSKHEQQLREAAEHPMLADALAQFPGAKITAVKPMEKAS